MQVKCFTLVIALCIVLFGCNNVEPSPTDDLRIVSLSPSMTATIVDIGYGDAVVGRSAFCKAVNQKVPVVGDLYDIDYERLLRLAPSHVLVQETASGVDEHLQNLAEQGYFVLHACRIDRLEDIKQLYVDLLQLVGEEPRELDISLQQQVQLPAPILIMTPGSKSSAGLCFGKETYLDDLLEMMGGKNALQRTGWVSLSLEDILKLEPAAIVIVSDSFISESAISGISELHLSTSGSEIKIIPFVHEDVLIPSSKIVDVATKLQGTLNAQ